MARTKIYLVRHGETEANRNGIIQGQLNTALNETGIRQAQNVACALRAIPFQKAYSSDLSRASETAKIILREHDGLVLEQMEELRERFMGAHQGHRLTELKHVNHDQKAESRAAFSHRIMTWWTTTLMEQVMPVGASPVLVITHGGFINTLVWALGAAQKCRFAEGVTTGKCRNCSITELDIDVGSREVIVLRYGDVSHVKEETVEGNADELPI